MTKKLVAIPEGNLLRIAAMKSIATLSDLKEKTGVDRKTLRTINTGRPVKETTLQAIADKLRIPLEYFHGPSTLDEVENSRSLTPDHLVDDVGLHSREIKLQQLDAAALRRLADETDQIIWLLKMDQMSESLEATLLQLRESLSASFLREFFGSKDAEDSLVDQISFIKRSADIDASVEQLAAQNLKMYGGVYVHWHKQFYWPSPEDDYDYAGFLKPHLRYTSRTKAVLSIAPEDKNNSTVRVATGWEPPQEFSTWRELPQKLPQKFIESELDGIEWVEIDGIRVWVRP